MFDNVSFNPGYAGMNNNICGTILGRQQWAGFEGSPTTGILNVHAPVEMVRGGIGLTYVNDQLGFEKILQDLITHIIWVLVQVNLVSELVWVFYKKVLKLLGKLLWKSLATRSKYKR